MSDTATLLSRLLQPSWRVERAVTALVTDARRQLPGDGNDRLDPLLDTLDRIDTHLDQIHALLEQVEGLR